MARPKSGEEKHVYAYVGARIANDLREAMLRKAKANGRSLSDEARAAFEAHVTRGKKSNRLRRAAQEVSRSNDENFIGGRCKLCGARRDM
jgi:hypothetical protein